MEGDSEELDEDQTACFRSSVLSLLHLSSERTDIQSTVRFFCTKLKCPMRQLKRLLRYVKGTEDMAVVFEVRGYNDKRVTTVKKLEVFTDSDWACGQATRTSTSGAVIMVEGMRLHAHGRGQATVALSSCEAGVVAASEGVKEALLLQEVLMFAGVAAGGVKLKKIRGVQNLADMLTPTPSAKELEIFLPLMGLRCCTGGEKDLVVTKQYKPVAANTEMVNSTVSV